MWNLEGMMEIPFLLFVSSLGDLSGLSKQIVFVALLPSSCVVELQGAEVSSRTS